MNCAMITHKVTQTDAQDELTASSPNSSKHNIKLGSSQEDFFAAYNNLSLNVLSRGQNCLETRFDWVMI